MVDHVRRDEAAFEDDFEWINAWAAAAAPPDPPGAKHDSSPANAMTPAVAAIDEASGKARPVASQGFAPQRALPQWTNLFRIVARASEPNATLEAQAPVALPLSARNLDDAQQRRDGDEIMLDAEQIERDIAEIEAARDRLSSAARRHNSAGRFAAVRTSDYVPILVGGVLAFTSLVVFGAAASFVSLR
jgi:hypothetical protein